MTTLESVLMFMVFPGWVFAFVGGYVFGFRDTRRHVKKAVEEGRIRIVR